MIDLAWLRRLLLLSSALILLAAGGVLMAGRSAALAGGLALGGLLGAAPFASWAWIAARGLSTRRNRILSALLMAAKLGLYAGALYLCVARRLVDPIGVFIGITAVVAIIVAGALMQTPRAREAA